MKLQVFGFAIIVAVAVGGVDYSMQARTAEQSLGVSGYIDSISGRFQAANETRALKGRQKQEVKTHLPEAPEGWVRNEWAAVDTTSIEIKSAAMSGWEKRKLAVAEVAPMMGGMVAADVNLAGRMQRKEIWVYQRGDEIIALRVAYTKTGAAKRFPGLDNKITAANTEAMKTAAPYAFVQGVVFGEIQPDLPGAEPVSYRGFSASMGSNVMIAVRANASDASVLALLGQINYDGLNGMLDVPLSGIGADAVDLAPKQQLAMAELAMEHHRVAMFGAPPVVKDAVAVDAVEEKEKPAATKAFEAGFDTVRRMPGQKCVRKAGSAFCGGLTH